MTGSGQTVLSRVIARGLDDRAWPSLAPNGRHWRGAWQAQTTNSDVLQSAMLNGRGTRPVTIASGVEEYPWMVALPGGGFGVVFSQENEVVVYELYLANLPPGRTHPSSIRQLGLTASHALLPHAVVDGSGHLDVLYLDLCYNNGVRNVRLRRFTLAGAPGGPGRIITVRTSDGSV